MSRYDHVIASFSDEGPVEHHGIDHSSGHDPRLGDSMCDRKRCYRALLLLALDLWVSRYLSVSLGISRYLSVSLDISHYLSMLLTPNDLVCLLYYVHDNSVGHVHVFLP